MLRRICKLLGFKHGDFQANADGNYVFAQGNTVPTDGASGYAVGCIFLHRDGSSGTTNYVNEGTESSCDFNSAPSLAADQTFTGDVTLSGATNLTSTFQIGGTTVNATAAELNLVTLTTKISDISGANIGYVVSPFAGTLTKVYTVVSGDPGAATTLTANVNGGVDVTATVAVANGSAAGAVDSATPADNNTVSVGDYIKLTSDGGALNAVSVVITFVITL